MRALLLVLLAGCTAEVTETPPDPAEAQAQVERYFRAVASEDCRTVRALQPSIASDEACAELLHEWEEHGVALVEIVGARPDGRDRDAIIVRARVRRNARVNETLIRATRSARGWTVRM